MFDKETARKRIWLSKERMKMLQQHKADAEQRGLTESAKEFDRRIKHEEKDQARMLKWI